MVTLYATYELNKKYPVVKLEFEPGDFKNRKETIYESYPSTKQALKRCAILNGCK